MSEQTNEQQQTPERLRLAQAMRQVFGTEKDRNADQALVWRWLEANAFVHASTIALKADHAIDPLRMSMHEGARRLVLAIDNEIRWVTTAPEKRPRVGQKKETR